MGMNDVQHESIWPSVGRWFRNLWDDWTGKSAITEQNTANLEMAKYQAQMQEDFYNKYSSPQALMRQFKEAGLNPNLVYGSASSGQSNVPGFNAPHVERNISGSDKLNKALSVMSAVQGVMQGVYQTTAAREAAEQSAISTLNHQVNLYRNKLDYDLERGILDFSPSLSLSPLYRRSSLGRRPRTSEVSLEETSLAPYIRAARESRMNNFYQAALDNAVNYGRYWDIDKGSKVLPELGYYQLRRNSAALQYDLQHELRNMGTYGKLAISLLNLLK